MKTFAIDPGTTESGWICMDGPKIVSFGIDANYKVVEHVKALPADFKLVIEMVQHFGMPAGASLFETCVWIGRFIQAAPCVWARIYRKDVKLFLCKNVRAKNANVRQALIDYYPATGGGKVPQIGTKDKPGPLYGVSKHIWQALALALTYQHSQGE